jgi:hypothetical protein
MISIGMDRKETGSLCCLTICGSGQAILTVRRFCEEASASNGALIRIDPRESSVPVGQIGIAAGALTTLQEIDKKLAEKHA